MKPERDQEPNFADDQLDHVESSGFDESGDVSAKDEAAVATKQRQKEAAPKAAEPEAVDEQTKIERVVQNYRVLRTISETPTSVVYKAEHKRTKRRVSIKVIYATQHTNSETINRARVEIERAVHLRHPGIAELIEAGTTDEGHCYFISDFVKGVTLDEYVSIHKLSTMQVYHDLVRRVLEEGEHKPSRTGVDTISLFGCFYSVDLADGFPLLTTKRVNFDAVLRELLWYLSGENHIRNLRQYTKIWDDWADEDGNLETAYGYYWRHFPSAQRDENGEWRVREVDQIQYVIDTIKREPSSRRLVVTA